MEYTACQISILQSLTHTLLLLLPLAKHLLNEMRLESDIFDWFLNIMPLTDRFSSNSLLEWVKERKLQRELYCFSLPESAIDQLPAPQSTQVNKTIHILWFLFSSAHNSSWVHAFRWQSLHQKHSSAVELLDYFSAAVQIFKMEP